MTGSELFRQPPQRFIDVEGGAVAVRSVGEGPDVLFVHGWPVSGATFRHLLPLLQPHVRCHVVDLVGAGQSRFDRSVPPSVGGHIEAVRTVVDALGLSDFAVVGHDSGGLIARHAFADDPRVRSWGLVNTEQPQGLNARFRQFLVLGRLPGFGALFGWVAMQRWLRRNPLLLGDAFGDRSLLDGEFEAFFLAPLQQSADLRWAATAMVRSFRTHYVDALADLHARMRAPVQLVWGAADPFFPVAWAREMVETFPDASLHEVPGAKLFVHEEAPEVVAEALLPTLLGKIRAEPAHAGSPQA